MESFGSQGLDRQAKDGEEGWVLVGGRLWGCFIETSLSPHLDMATLSHKSKTIEGSQYKWKGGTWAATTGCNSSPRVPRDASAGSYGHSSHTVGANHLTRA